MSRASARTSCRARCASALRSPEAEAAARCGRTRRPGRATSREGRARRRREPDSPSARAINGALKPAFERDDVVVPIQVQRPRSEGARSRVRICSCGRDHIHGDGTFTSQVRSSALRPAARPVTYAPRGHSDTTPTGPRTPSPPSRNAGPPRPPRAPSRRQPRSDSSARRS